MKKQKYSYRLMATGIKTKAVIAGQLAEVFHEDKDGKTVPGWRVPYYSEEKFVYAVDDADAERQVLDKIEGSGKWHGFTIPRLVQRRAQ